MHRHTTIAASLLLCLSAAAHASQPWVFGDNTRFLAMGDSLTAGYGAMPMTEGYAFQLYRQGAYDAASDTVFANAAVPGATSAQVLAFQVPLAVQSGFDPHVIAMTVGGNDLLSILNGADPFAVLGSFQSNLAAILGTLCSALPQARIYVANMYAIDGFPVPTAAIVGAFNQVVSGVTAFSNATSCGGRAVVADVHAAFDGNQTGLLLVHRNGAGLFEAHPSNAGHRAMASAFIAARP